MSAYTAMVISNALHIIGIASVVIFAPGYWKFMAIVVLVSGYKVEKK